MMFFGGPKKGYTCKMIAKKEGKKTLTKNTPPIFVRRIFHYYLMKSWKTLSSIICNSHKLSYTMIVIVVMTQVNILDGFKSTMMWSVK
jgi:hypothetical protein